MNVAPHPAVEDMPSTLMRRACPLASRRAQQAGQDPNWFCVPENFIKATERAFQERRMVFHDAAASRTEPLWTSMSLPKEAIAKRMRKVATLAASEGEDAAALMLLGRSFQFAPLDATGAIAVQRALGTMPGGVDAQAPKMRQRKLEKGQPTVPGCQGRRVQEGCGGGECLTRVSARLDGSP